jgi:hypothetical protein
MSDRCVGLGGPGHEPANAGRLGRQPDPPQPVARPHRRGPGSLGQPAWALSNAIWFRWRPPFSSLAALEAGAGFGGATCLWSFAGECVGLIGCSPTGGAEPARVGRRRPCGVESPKRSEQRQPNRWSRPACHSLWPHDVREPVAERGGVQQASVSAVRVGTGLRRLPAGEGDTFAVGAALRRSARTSRSP